MTKRAAPARQWPIDQLVEGVHYYREDGLMVLTEAYHLARGRCCGNRCRHCPFDHINVRSKRG
ncbi:DUF5522 domain-containing protein [Arenicella chitinivorans]|uniref:DUF5522 domain-containing protein n=1 Tax=Arenicella chitinivorans TaxID=1329800 RepID=UPI00167AA566